MPIPLGILAAAGVRAAGGSYELIETITVGSGGAASVTFSNLNTYSTTYQHLQIRAVTRDTSTLANALGTFMRFNGVTSNSYAWHWLFGNGSSVTSQAFPNTNRILAGIEATASSTSNAFGTHVLDILDPFETAKNTTTRSLSGTSAGGNIVLLSSGVFLSTDSITSVTLIPEFDSFAQHSRFSLYGLKAA